MKNLKTEQNVRTFIAFGFEVWAYFYNDPYRPFLVMAIIYLVWQLSSMMDSVEFWLHRKSGKEQK